MVLTSEVNHIRNSCHNRNQYYNSIITTRRIEIKCTFFFCRTWKLPKWCFYFFHRLKRLCSLQSYTIQEMNKKTGIWNHGFCIIQTFSNCHGQMWVYNRNYVSSYWNKSTALNRIWEVVFKNFCIRGCIKHYHIWARYRPCLASALRR